MGVDIDILEHCKKVRADHGPPYACPIEKCGRSYKTVCGLQYHLKSYNHDNPTPPTPSKATPATPKNKKGRKGPKASAISTPAAALVTAPEPLTFEEAQKMVQFEIDGVVCRWNIDDPLEVIAKEDTPPPEGAKTEGDSKDDQPIVTPIPSAITPSLLVIQLPEANYKELEDYNICDAPPRPNAYIRFIEKSTEELDGEVEYDVDEEDTAWLGIMNERREAQGLPPVSVDSLELLMDRLEKESYFQAAVNGHSSGAVVDDDAVCCICMDGECQNTNVILFCDMCNLAVHQDCYGVPYIPEGQWLCRRCLQSPSRPVDCVLCPNQGGAFKQTDKGTWAHVVCALWIPEVRFANTVFLEPIDSIETIPAARWRLSCYVCKQKGVGACIQCHRNSCYAAFHVTCAQQAGLYMRMDAVKGKEVAGQPVLVQKIAFCDTHAPPEEKFEKGDKKEDARKKMIQARKVLAKKRTCAPVILMPTIPPERIQEIASLVTITKKSQFIQRLIAYWTLKRQYRNGVPLLRRLQSAQGGTRDSNTSNVDTIELCRQLKYWQCLRQDLERARLLCELVRKREKMKLEYTRTCEKIVQVKLKPLQACLGKVLDLIEAKDTNEIFIEPVDLEEVPDYTTVVTEPMDLSTMRQKQKDGLYADLAALEKDFDLMIANCLAYNNKDTVFYKAGIKMRDQCGFIFRQAKKELESAGLLKKDKNTTKGSTGATDESLASDIDKELESLQGKSGPEVIQKLEDLLAKSQALKHGLARAKRVKIVRSELVKARKNIGKESQKDEKAEIESQPTSQSELETEHTDQTDVASQSDGDGDENSSINSTLDGSSAGGVNRRTTVLFSKKGSASGKKEEDKEKSETDLPFATPKGKNKGRGRKRTPGNVPKTMDPSNLTKDQSDVPDSFKIYRGGKQTTDDEKSDSDNSLSTCYSHDPSEIESDEEDEDSDIAESGIEKVLQPLQLVWAKCRGYPWYPALIIDPGIPKGFEHKGVPLPTPPPEVLKLGKKCTEHVYLVLFFDVKRTWQWLPADKLELMGVDNEKDEAKANEPRKQSDRKAVRKAYENALNYIQQIAEATEAELKLELQTKS
ncbi:peregrin [Anthonomus grandis grandis]|uniref:peregrin n=1 Tax=Anthonomus grandis grandis TaxID=2921223 RepID=UPI00216600C3|nr:peregrin [Anthonomus grandis grandis]XP_050316304.1 peregrin [Anthonomus grandis grandis]